MKKNLLLTIALLFVAVFFVAAQEAEPVPVDYTIPAWITTITGFLLIIGQFLIANKWVALTKYIIVALAFLKKVLVWITYVIDFLTKLIEYVPNKGEVKK